MKKKKEKSPVNLTAKKLNKNKLPAGDTERNSLDE